VQRTTLSALAVLGLVVLAGCAGITGSDGGSGDYPAADDVGATTIDDHVAALDGTSFTTTVNLSSGGAQTTSTIQVDPGDDQYLQLSETVLGSTALYTSGDESYQRSGSGNDTQVQRADSPVNATAARSGGQLLAVFISENVTYEQAGTETVDGVEAMRYEAEGPDALSQSVRDTVSGQQALTNFSATILIDADGVIREFQTTLGGEQNGETTSTTYTVTVTDVGSTDVEEPSWVSAANTTTTA